MKNGSSKRGVGRPKARPQTGPLVLEGSLARTKLEVELGEETASELTEYARWVELSSSLATGDAVFTTIDYALRELFRRDRLWHAAKRAPAPQVAAPAAAPGARSLPPPVGSATNRGGSDRPV
jgi:hypothetical protein